MGRDTWFSDIGKCCSGQITASFHSNIYQGSILQIEGEKRSVEYTKAEELNCTFLFSSFCTFLYGHLHERPSAEPSGIFQRYQVNYIPALPAGFHLLFVSASTSRLFRPISRRVSRRRNIFVQSAHLLQVDEKMYEHSLFLYIYAVIELIIITISVKIIFYLLTASVPVLIRRQLSADNRIDQLRSYGCLSSS